MEDQLPQPESWRACKGDLDFTVEFKEIYDQLYNSGEDDNSHMIRDNIDHVSCVCAKGFCESSSCHYVYISLMSDRSKQSHELNPSHIINGSESLCDILPRAFNSKLLYGCWNTRLYKSLIKLILKNKKKFKIDFQYPQSNSYYLYFSIV